MYSLRRRLCLNGLFRATCWLIILLLFSCAPRPLPPVVERATINSRLETDKLGGRVIRIVQSGDTLYSIAFVHSLDVNQLAQWNDISDTGRLVVGQRIRLTKPIGFKPKDKPIKVVVSKPNLSKPAKVKKTLPKPAVSQGSPKSVVTPRTVVTTNKSVKPNIVQAWLWPVDGKVIENFSISKGQQGIAIESSARSQVRATKGGEVVYVGNGLKGYGNLVNVKHSEHFLSAYAHNDTTYVSEGQVIKQKDLIGLSGRDNKRRHALHFQIRKDGQPVNPLSYLQKK